MDDYPGGDPDCDAVVASNGGLAYVYLQNCQGRWADTPDFERHVHPYPRAFWEAHATGKYASELEGTLSGVLIRNVEQEGWSVSYQALTPGGEILSLLGWFVPTFQHSNVRTPQRYVDPVHHLNNLAGPLTGDLLLISNYAEGFYFSAPDAPARTSHQGDFIFEGLG